MATEVPIRNYGAELEEFLGSIAEEIDTPDSERPRQMVLCIRKRNGDTKYIVYTMEDRVLDVVSLLEWVKLNVFADHIENGGRKLALT